MFFEPFYYWILHYILCAFYGYILYLLFVFGYFSWHTGFIKDICYENCLFGCFIIFFSQLVLTSTAFYKVYYFGTEMAHACQCADKLYSNQIKCELFCTK